MVCLGCRRIGDGSVCSVCALSLRPAPERFVAPVGVVRSAFVHRDVARVLVHHLKYRGIVAAGRVLAEAMVPLIPRNAVIVPVPRVRWRLLRYGVDPAIVLARTLGRLTGQPVAPLLTAPWLGRPRAGRDHGAAPRFRSAVTDPTGPLVLIDDVITTGATLRAAAGLIAGPTSAVTATAAVSPLPEVTSLPAASSIPVWR